MKSAFNPVDGKWAIAWPECVSRHDLVYQTPPADPLQGIPLGNGDVGALIWFDEHRLIMAVNKCDLWEDSESGRFHNWHPDEEEFSTTQRHACRMVIDFKMPVFHIFYLESFVARLSLADASMHMDLSGPFGQIQARIFVNHADGLLCGNLSTNLIDGVSPDVRLERYGSRTFSHWYRQVNRDPALGLSGTNTHLDPDFMALSHHLKSNVFSVACKVTISDGQAATYQRLHAHAVFAKLPNGNQSLEWRLAVGSPVLDRGDFDPVKQARNLLLPHTNDSVQMIHDLHRLSWKDFWLRSHMQSGDDYLDNLWHLTQYYAASSQRGSYPGRFINGLWSWSHDVQPWNFYFHWNQQEIYWPLHAAGHHELLDAYLDYNFRALPIARQDAVEVFHTAGAVVSDVRERRGYNSVGEFDNHTPVAQIALDFWHHYRYTCDLEFLKTRALPYLIEAATFFSTLFEKEDDGLFHARKGAAYEGWIHVHDGLTELAYGKVLFATVLSALKEADQSDPDEPLWRDLGEHLAPIPTIEAPQDWIDLHEGRPVYRLGPYRGETAQSRIVLSAGYGIEENRYLTSRKSSEPQCAPQEDTQACLRRLLHDDKINTLQKHEMVCHDGLFPVAEYASVFPNGPIGLNQKNENIFDAVCNTVKLYAPDCMGWDPYPVVMARLGLGEDLYETLRRFADRWQFYVNGFGHYGPLDTMFADAQLPFRTTRVLDTKTAVKDREQAWFDFPSWPFRHMGMESMSVLACAMNESLMQSHEDKIRVFPAVSADQTARFTLHARNGFVVSAEIVGGSVPWIHVESLFGQSCRMEIPWSKAYIYEDGQLILTCTDSVISFQTQSKARYLIVPNETVFSSWKTVMEYPQTNQSAKSNSPNGASLGLPQLY